jgi:hypothetical protein
MTSTSFTYTSTQLFNNLPSQTLIRFKYAGGSSPNTLRDVHFHSFTWISFDNGSKGQGYVKASDSPYNPSHMSSRSNCLKTYVYSKMSDIQIIGTCSYLPDSEPESNSEPDSESESNSESEYEPESNSEPDSEPESDSESEYELESEPESDSELESEPIPSDWGRWTDFLKKNDIIHITYRNQSFSRKVTFLHFENSTKHLLDKIKVNENGTIKSFIINYIKFHNLIEPEPTEPEPTEPESTESDNILNTTQILHNEVRNLESKQTLLIKEMRAHIYSQNDIIKELEAKCLNLADLCTTTENSNITFKEQLNNAYATLTQHKTLYPSTWDGNYPKDIYGWEVINPPTNN